ncbi:probable serine hydrolase [Drosophila bipectinata]|uniref:probable serine hydrolase n=1 Tax=Drosophila bipectinata TaxID=42026 RepID=UPI001C893956|nr:probable serine hydrolase [Drosophila bipectinata]
MGTLSLKDYEEVRIPAPWGHISGRWYGNRTERPILALHGWLDNSGTFDRLIPLLPDYIGVLCIDLPGHGRSSPLPPGVQYSINDYVYIIPRVMREYNWKKVSLMGHSLGGVLSFIYGALAPHTIDMIISLDILIPLRVDIDNIASSLEKLLVEEERQDQGNLHEPPSYTFSQLGTLLAKGSHNSVTPELAPHLLHRQVIKSQLYPERYYFSRDGRVKYYHYIDIDPGLDAEMARQLRRKPFLIIKGAMSPYLPSRVPAEGPMSILAENNPHFEFHSIEGGTHHIHLHAAEECARYIVPFIQNHRPPPLTSWSLNGKEEDRSHKIQSRRNGLFGWGKKRRSKL